MPLPLLSVGFSFLVALNTSELFYSLFSEIVLMQLHDMFHLSMLDIKRDVVNIYT